MCMDEVKTNVNGYPVKLNYRQKKVGGGLSFETLPFLVHLKMKEYIWFKGRVTYYVSFMRFISGGPKSVQERENGLPLKTKCPREWEHV